jgi:hypothetical protein
MRPSAGQKILPDTFFVSFHSDTLIELRHICIREVTDKRNETPNFVRYESKNKYLLVPVDQEVYTDKPLAEEICKGFSCDRSGREYHLEINKFLIEKQKGRLNSSLYLVADIPVYEYVNDSMVFRGTFFYDYLYFPQAKRESIEESTQNILRDWHTDFKLGLLSLNSKPSERPIENCANLITDKSIRSLYVNSSIASFVGINWWGVQGEVFFMRPETNKRNRYISGIIRYQNSTEYESISLGKQSEHYFYRLNSGWTFDIDYNFLIGFCKWKELDESKPTLYQLMDFELSSAQTIEYNPLNKRGLTCRLGFIESINYIIARDLKFRIGLFLGIGVKI